MPHHLSLKDDAICCGDEEIAICGFRATSVCMPMQSRFAANGSGLDQPLQCGRFDAYRLLKPQAAPTPIMRMS